MRQRWRHASLVGIGVQVDNARERGELGQLAGGAVVETRADHDQQVRFLHRHVRGAGAVHAQHAQVIRMPAGQCT
jgi:hypothetical protein